MLTFAKLMYVPGYTERLAKIFRNILNIKVVQKAHNTMTAMFPRLKVKDSMWRQSGVVYSIPQGV